MNEGTQEDFEWLLREIGEGGGGAVWCEARLIDGIPDEEVRCLFNQARDADYDAITKEALAAAKSLRPKLKSEAINDLRNNPPAATRASSRRAEATGELPPTRGAVPSTRVEACYSNLSTTAAMTCSG
jgi:hypothetical protein